MRWIALVAGIGCAQPPVDAPDQVADLGSFLFRSFENDDGRTMEAGLANLITTLEGEDYTVAPEERALTMPILASSSLGELSLPPGVLAEDQVAVSISGLSEFPLDEQVRIAVDPIQTCLESKNTAWAGRSFQTDPDCFASGGCDRLETLTEVRRTFSVFLDLWYDQLKTYRRFTVTKENGVDVDVIVGRAWIEQVFEGEGGGTSMDQLFHLDVYAEGGDGATLRWFSMWSSLSGLPIDNSRYANLVVDGLSEALRFGDEYLGGQESSCPHDRDAERPERAR